MKLRHDTILVAIPPAVDATKTGILLAPSHRSPATSGHVLRVGPECRDVAPGDRVLFPPNAMQVDWQVGAHHCVFLRERQISAVIPAQERV